MKKRILAAFLAAVCLIAALALPVSAAEDILVKPDTFYHNPGFHEITVGDTIDLAPMMTTDDDTGVYAPANSKPKWSSRDPEIVSVTQKGKAAALKTGIAKISVTYATAHGNEFVEDTIYLTVTEGEADTPPANYLRIHKEKEINMAELFFPGAEGGNFQWDVQEKFLASVDKNGILKAEVAGQCWIVATHTDANGGKTTKNIALDVNAEHHAFDRIKVTLAPGEKIDMIEAIFPGVSELERRLYTCRTDPAAVAKVGEDQNVTLKKAGEGSVIIIKSDLEGAEEWRQGVKVVVEE
jgi:plastocyanin